MNFQYLLFERKDNVGILSISRSDALNAWNSKVLDELDEAIDMIIEDTYHNRGRESFCSWCRYW